MSAPLTAPELKPVSPFLPKELLASTMFLLARLGFLIKARVLNEFEQAGFSTYQYGVLAILGEGTCETQGTIADVLDLDRGQLVHVLDDLEGRGLIERQRDPGDRRRHTVSITPEGKQQLRKLRRLVGAIEESVLEPLRPEARKALHDTLLEVGTHNDPRFGRP
jgi:MarR family transcriptional regulator, lower aerobic nicotinate degradation pathway regulator